MPGDDDDVEEAADRVMERACCVREMETTPGRSCAEGTSEQVEREERGSLAVLAHAHETFIRPAPALAYRTGTLTVQL